MAFRLRRALPLPTFALLLALSACGETFPEGSAPVAAPAVVTSQPATVTTAPTVISPSPAPTVISPGPGSQTAVVAPAPGVAGTTTAVVVPARLTANEITGVVSGNTASGIAENGRPYFALFKPDGRLQFRQDEFHDAGEWRVLPDGRLCSRLTKINAGGEECYSIYREGTNLRYDRPDGNKIGTFTVQPGNPQNL